MSNALYGFIAACTGSIIFAMNCDKWVRNMIGAIWVLFAIIILLIGV